MSRARDQTGPGGHHARMELPRIAKITMAVCAALALHVSHAPSQGTGPTHAPNIVFILADDLGYSDLACFGSELYATPNIDRLAAQGMRFTSSYAACNVCSPTRASIMTGKYPARLHLTDYIPGGRDRTMRSPEWTRYLPDAEVTIAEHLASRGYACGHFGKWHLNRDKNYRPGRPLDPASQGFDTVLTTVKPRADAPSESDPHHVDEITDAAIGFIERHRNGPFFCYVAHNSVHRPVIGRPDLVSRYAARVRPEMRQRSPAYAAMVHHLDESVGRLLGRLDELDIADDTLVVFTSDNGGFMGDEKDDGTSNAPLRGGKGTNYEGGVRVPTIIRWPGVTAAGSRCDEPIISNDFFATLLDAAGHADAPRHDGLSLVPLLRDPAARLDRDALYWHYPHDHALGATPHGAIRAGDWKLIEFYTDMHVELYNLAEDLGETTDLAATRRDKTDVLRAALHAWREQVGAQMPQPAH